MSDDIREGMILQSEERPRLKKCPFCGGDTEWIGFPPDGEYIISCKDCGASMTGWSYEQAAERWNKRVKGEGK